MNKVVESDDLAWLSSDLPGHPVEPCPYEDPADAPWEDRSIVKFFLKVGADVEWGNLAAVATPPLKQYFILFTYPIVAAGRRVRNGGLPHALPIRILQLQLQCSKTLLDLS